MEIAGSFCLLRHSREGEVAGEEARVQDVPACAVPFKGIPYAVH